MHPLMRDLTKLSDTELHDKITAALSRMTYFQSMGNTAAYQQVTNIYYDLLNEHTNRQVAEYQRQHENHDATDAFDDLIQVKK